MKFRNAAILCFWAVGALYTSVPAIAKSSRASPPPPKVLWIAPPLPDRWLATFIVETPDGPRFCPPGDFNFDVGTGGKQSCTGKTTMSALTYFKSICRHAVLLSITPSEHRLGLMNFGFKDSSGTHCEADGSNWEVGVPR